MTSRTNHADHAGPNQLTAVFDHHRQPGRQKTRRKGIRISFDEYLSAVSPFSTSFLNDAFISQLKKISTIFSNCSSNYIFETELGSNNPKMDFSLCILKSELGGLLEHWRNEKIRTIIQQDSIWKRLFLFCSGWGNTGSSLNRNISDIWFEFDSHQLKKEVPGACFFFSPNCLHKRICRDLFERNIDWLFEGLCILFDEYLSVNFKKNVTRCIKELPENGVIFQIGVMMSRDFSSIRICTCMPIENYRKYLEKIGWKGSFEYLDQILLDLRKYVDAVFIDIDTGENIHTKIGMECGYRGGINISKGPGLEKFLAYLIKQKICTGEKAESILIWGENSHKKLDHISKETNIIRTLSHIKIVLNTDNSLIAKAYLNFSTPLGLK